MSQNNSLLRTDVSITEVSTHIVTLPNSSALKKDKDAGVDSIEDSEATKENVN